MQSKIQSIIQILGIVACVVEAAPQPVPSDHDDSLMQYPGIKFIKASPSTTASTLSDRRAVKSRFQNTETWAPIHAYQGPVKPGRPHSAAATLSRLKRDDVDGSHRSYENVTESSANGLQYSVEVAFNQQRLLLNLDTGSADTWAVSSHLNCTPSWMESRRCLFGPGYTGGFNTVNAPSEHMYVEYGDGEQVQGPMGTVDVDIAGIRVVNQTVGLANTTQWIGNNITSGLLGLAYPSLTNAFIGSMDEHEQDYGVKYSPIFANMVKQGLVDDWFSLALDRNGSGGALGFGGVPDHIKGVDYSTTAITDIIIANVINKDFTATDYSFYTIIPDGWAYGSDSDLRKVPFIVDSGTSLIYTPSGIAESINNAFDPPASYDLFSGSYVTYCDAVPPRVAVVIDGTNFYLNPKDLLVPVNNILFSKDMCMSTITDGGSGPYILGDVFLHNVVAVFDVGDAVMQFASRPRY